MSIRRIDGCIFNSSAQALLNPVNCVGVVSTSWIPGVRTKCQVPPLIHSIEW